MKSSRVLLALVVVALTSSTDGFLKRAACLSLGMRDSIREQILKFHNDARRRVAMGKEPGKYGMLNPAMNMYKLEWNCTMELQAQSAVSSCPSSPRSWPNMAQNIITWTSSVHFSSYITSYINSSLSSWWRPALSVGVTDPDNKYTNTNLYTFANMVFSETTEIGCALQICWNKLSFTCLYNGIGYYNKATMWHTGPACSKASDCTTYANSQCEDGLCVQGEPIPETNDICPSNEGMTDSVRQRFLGLHNGFRSSLARGLEKDALSPSGFAPKAKQMLKMVYDCSIEASALRHANKCVYRHSIRSDRKWSGSASLGENIYMTNVREYGKVKAATQASQLWWNELKDYGVGRSNVLTEALFYRPGKKIGHYTQMAWETSYRLGCAIAHCPSFTFGVCQYGPTGNYFNRLIYTIGEPCTSDAGCPGSYTCNDTEGLCNVVE